MASLVFRLFGHFIRSHPFRNFGVWELYLSLLFYFISFPRSSASLGINVKLDPP